MARPRNVATTLPTIPNTVVNANPWGLFGEGESHLAMIPATAPTIIAQITCMVVALLSDPLAIEHSILSSRQAAVWISWLSYFYGKVWALVQSMAGFLSLDELFEGRHFDREII